MIFVRNALALGALSVLLLSQRADGAPKGVRRVAVVVGANAATPGRAPLRFAHTDARDVASVLTELGRFAVDDVHLLFDPRPAEVLAAIDAAKTTLASASGESLLVFYYSGHADDHSLYPGGEPLPLDALRGRLDASSASVRIGIIDTCRGGGWTRAKGLVAGEPFEVNDPLTLEAQGSVLIASSSGLENAHETEALQGSFFTHHLVAGLRGAADQSDDGEVTLVEAFSYARALTVRDTALATDAPQHPSFRFNLSGQKDLPLTRVKASESLLTVVQLHGPLRLIHLPSGHVVAELPPGPRSVTLAVSPGRYLVSTAPFGAARAHRELTVGTGAPARVTESELDETRQSNIESKHFSRAAMSTLSSMPRGGIEVVVAAGVVHTEIARSRDDKPFDYRRRLGSRAGGGVPRAHLQPHFAGARARDERWRHREHRADEPRLCASFTPYARVALRSHGRWAYARGRAAW